MTIQDCEHNDAWRLYLLLKQLGDVLWQRYEEDFIERRTIEEQNEALRTDADQTDWPF